MSLKSDRRSRPAPRGLALSACAAAVMLAGAMPALAGDAGGMRVVRDPVSGQLRAPTHEEFKAMEAQEQKSKPLSKSSKVAPQQVTATPEIRANGTRRMMLDESSMTYSVISRKADGSLGGVQCVTGEKAAETSVKGPKFGAVLTREQAHELQ